jgi:dipeptidyl aminopeptidase/acylaminoacyl peptidase
MDADKNKKCREKNAAYRSTYKILIHNLATEETVKVMPMPENFYVGWIQWASKDRLLASIGSATTVGKGGRSYKLGASRIISVALKKGEKSDQHSFAVLFGDQKKVQRQNRYLSRITNSLPNDPKHIIMPAYRGGELDLWKVNIEDGTSDRLAAGAAGTFYWYTDKAGKPVLRFDCSSRTCRKVNIFSPEKTGGNWKLIKSFEVKPEDDEDDYDFWPIAPTDNPTQFLVLSDEDDDPRRAIKIFDLETETYVKTVYEHPSVDVGGALLDYKTGDYAGAWFFEDRLQFVANNPRLQTHYKAMNKYFDNQANISLRGYSEDGTKAVVYVSGNNIPGAYYVYDFASANLKLIFRTDPSLQDRLGSELDVLRIGMRDGQEITAYHRYPAGKKHANLPLLVIPHGGPELRDYNDYDGRVEYFVAQGYQVLQVNFRGSGGYGKKFAKSGYGEWGGRMQNDVTDSVRHLHDAGLASAKNTCIVGYSYGGYAALYGGASTPSLYKCVVSGGGISDIPMFLMYKRKDYGKDSETYDYWLDSIGDPKIVKNELAAKSPVNLAENFTAPVLLLHGENDGIVYAEHSRKMKKALEKAGKHAELIVVDDEYHSGWDLENEIFYHETVEAFLAKHLTGQTP